MNAYEFGPDLAPGSLAASIAGCLCPVADNNHGRGFPGAGFGERQWWINEECPLHGDLEEVPS